LTSDIIGGAAGAFDAFSRDGAGATLESVADVDAEADAEADAVTGAGPVSRGMAAGAGGALGARTCGAHPSAQRATSEHAARA
jgi:hypothetical protein